MLKPCPFCGSELNWQDGDDFYLAGWYCRCDDSHCNWGEWPALGNKWNTRPIEDELLSRISELEVEVSKLREGIS